MHWADYVRKNEAIAARRRLHFHLVDLTDGFTPETGEAAGQPEISIDGAAFSSSGIGTLTAIGYGDYYAEVAQAAVNLNDGVIRGRYKSANTREARSLNVLIVGVDLREAAGALTNTTVADIATGNLTVKKADGTTTWFTIADSGVSGTEQTMTRN